jgi:AraC family transcriptional regulator
VGDLNLLFVRRTGFYGESPWQAWDAMWKFIEESSLDWSQLRYFSLLHDDERITEADKVRCDACIQALPGIRENAEVGRQVLKGGKYAVFTHKGPYENLEEVCAGIFFNLLLKKEGFLDDTRPSFLEHYRMELEHYQNKDPHFDSSQLITKIYMPVT